MTVAFESSPADSTKGRKKGRARNPQDLGAMRAADRLHPFSGAQIAQRTMLNDLHASRLVARTVAARQPVSIADVRTEVLTGLAGAHLSSIVDELVALGHVGRDGQMLTWLISDDEGVQ